MTITITGQIRGGKNHVQITRTGHRYPNKAWAAWRDDAVRQIRAQLPAGFKAFSAPVTVTLIYVAGDKRCRDMPAIIDSIWHCLEKSGVVENDQQLWIEKSSRSYDKAQPGATMELRC